MKRVSFMRYSRVWEILQCDPLLRRKLSVPEVAICRPDQSHKLFPKEVITVTEEIHRRDLDATTLAKIEIIRIAHAILVKNDPLTPAPPEPVNTKSKPMKAEDKTREKPIAVMLEERIALVETAIEETNKRLDTLKVELYDCRTALEAVQNKPKPNVPKPSVLPASVPATPDPVVAAPRRYNKEQVEVFQHFVLDLLRRKGQCRVQDVLAAYTEEALLHNTCWSRLKTMANNKLLTFCDGLISSHV